MRSTARYRMFWTIAGLVITTIVSLESVVNSDRKKILKVLLSLIAIGGFGIAIGSAISDNRENQLKQHDAKAVQASLDTANARLASQGKLLDLVNFTVGDLGILNRLSAGHRYYVQIAADTSADRLKPFLDRIQQQFPGAKASGLVSIRKPVPPSRNYILAFGNGLDLAAAEVFQRLADNHRFPPHDQFAVIQSEPAAPRADDLPKH